MSFLQGEVSFFAEPAQGWQPAWLNYPVSAENSLWTGRDGRAEIRIGAAAIHLGSQSVLDVTRVDDDRSELLLQRGSMAIRSGQPEPMLVRTGAGTVTIDGVGRFRIDADNEGIETRVTVFDGRADFASGGRRIAVEAGASLVARSAGSDSRNEFAAESDLDQWAEARNRIWVPVQQRIVVDPMLSPGMTGVEDLQSSGVWVDDAEYGRIWSPIVVADWAPYRYGRWAWVAPWGWTWIDDAPWGFAPFHYGRWLFLRNRWCWWPGPRTPHPVYAPALVSWFGDAAWRSRTGFRPDVRWVPLAPHEHYLPWYAHGNDHLHRVNGTDGRTTIVPPRVYANQNNGATTINRLRPATIGTTQSPRTVVPQPERMPSRTLTPNGVEPREPREPRRQNEPRRLNPPNPSAPVTTVAEPRPMPARTVGSAGAIPVIKPPAAPRIENRAPQPVPSRPAGETRPAEPKHGEPRPANTPGENHQVHPQ
ncbi:MAG: FecR domain-containing protein [Betaproteobacteria bacterium]|nr:FecR domain-containing protein [Betaproteobacteria bacterium]